MKRALVIILLLIVIGVCIFFLASIINDGGTPDDSGEGPDDPVSIETENPDDDSDESEDPDEDSDVVEHDDSDYPEDTETPANPAIDQQSITLNLYTIDYDTMECVPNETNVDTSFVKNADNIIAKVIETFIEKPIILQTETVPDGVVVYFDNEAVPVKGVSEDMETAMLDSICYSLIDNLEDCKNVYIRTNQGAYVSDNMSLEYDESYLSSEL